MEILKLKIIEMKISLSKLNRFNLKEEFSNVQLNRYCAILSTKRKKMKENEQNLRKMWNIIKYTNTRMLELPNRRQKVAEEKYLKNNDGNFPNLMKYISLYI